MIGSRVYAPGTGGRVCDVGGEVKRVRETTPSSGIHRRKARARFHGTLLLVIAAMPGFVVIVSAWPTWATPPPGPTIAIRPSPEDDRPAFNLFETDEFNTAKLCAQGIVVSKDHRSRSCKLGRSRRLDVSTTFGGVTVTLFATRSSYDSDGGYGLREEVLILDEKGRALHSLVQWRHDVFDAHSSTLRRRFRLVNIDRRDDDEMCVQSTTTTGPGRFDESSVFRPSDRWTGYDAFAWGNGRFVRTESLDGGCPTHGYQLFVPMPLTDDPVHRSRNR